VGTGEPFALETALHAPSSPARSLHSLSLPGGAPHVRGPGIVHDGPVLLYAVFVGLYLEALGAYPHPMYASDEELEAAADAAGVEDPSMLVVEESAV
jgi:hypothetical protein